MSVSIICSRDNNTGKRLGDSNFLMLLAIVQADPQRARIQSRSIWRGFRKIGSHRKIIDLNDYLPGHRVATSLFPLYFEQQFTTYWYNHKRYSPKVPGIVTLRIP